MDLAGFARLASSRTTMRLELRLRLALRAPSGLLLNCAHNQYPGSPESDAYALRRSSRRCVLSCNRAASPDPDFGRRGFGAAGSESSSAEGCERNRAESHSEKSTGCQYTRLPNLAGAGSNPSATQFSTERMEMPSRSATHCLESGVITFCTDME